VMKTASRNSGGMFPMGKASLCFVIDSEVVFKGSVPPQQ
jgi:hypothetical protein